jgi:hypothetical protein
VFDISEAGNLRLFSGGGLFKIAHSDRPRGIRTTGKLMRNLKMDKRPDDLRRPSAPKPLMIDPTGRGFPVLCWLAAVVRRRQAVARGHFCAPMPSLCHASPGRLAASVAREFGHAFTFSRAV